MRLLFFLIFLFGTIITSLFAEGLYLLSIAIIVTIIVLITRRQTLKNIGKIKLWVAFIIIAIVISILLSRVYPEPEEKFIPFSHELAKDYKKLRVGMNSPFDISPLPPSILDNLVDLFPDKINNKKSEIDLATPYDDALKGATAKYGDISLSLAYFKETVEGCKSVAGANKAKGIIITEANKILQKYETNNSVIIPERYSISDGIEACLLSKSASGATYWVLLETNDKKVFTWRNREWVFSIEAPDMESLKVAVDEWKYCRNYIEMFGISLTLHFLLLGVYMLLRAYIIILSMNYFNQIVSVEELKHGCLKIKARDLAYTLPISLNILPIIRTTLVNTLVAFRLKGGFKRNRFKNIKMLTFTVIMNSVKMAEELAQVMEVNADYLFKENEDK